MSENEVLEPNMSVTLVDNQRIQVLTRSTPTELLPQIGGQICVLFFKNKVINEKSYYYNILVFFKYIGLTTK